MAWVFLFTDIEGSTRAWERAPAAMDAWLSSHDRRVTTAIGAHGGRVFKHTGDGVCAVFRAATDAARAACDVHRALAETAVDTIGGLRSRIALHVGDAHERDGDFFGPTLNRCARLLEAAHGGQTLLSDIACALLRESANVDEFTLLDLGRHRLRDLLDSQRIWQLGAPGLSTAFPPPRSLDSFVQNLPLQRSSFVGREAEQERVRTLLGAHRLVTITGVGGCGKTRLALQVAAAELSRFSDGVAFVDLAPIHEPDLVGSALAAAVDLPGGPGHIEDRLRQVLADRQMLVVLDNCEHLLDACAAFLDRLLAICPLLTVLATSREPLGLVDEHVWRVPSLRLPIDASAGGVLGSEAGRLFADRAAAVRPAFELTDENASAVDEVCRRLDGIPLAIELAASRCAHLTPREIADRLSDRFRLLGHGRRGVQRQQTLHAVLDWSHELLTNAERVLLRRLAVFVGGWDLRAAEAVCRRPPLDEDAILDLLARLAARSLVEVDDLGEHTRYRLLETVRTYALERLLAAGEADATHEAHAKWYLHRAEAAPDGRPIAIERLWFVTGTPSGTDLLPDVENARRAAEWFRTEGRIGEFLRVATAVTNTLHFLGRLDEVDEWLSLGRLHDSVLDAPLRVRCRSAEALAHEMRGDFFAANDLARQAIAAAEDPADAGAAYSLLVGNMTWIDPMEAERLLTTAPAWTQRLGPGARQYIDHARGSLCNARGDHAGAISFFSGLDLRGPGTAPLELVVAYLMNDDPDAAAACLDRLRNLRTPAWFWYGLPLLRAVVAAQRGQPATACAEMDAALTEIRRWQLPLGLADAAVGFAALAYHAGDAERAAEILAAVQAATGGGLRSPVSMSLFRGYLRRARAALDPAAVSRARARGMSLTLDAVVAREAPPR